MKFFLSSLILFCSVSSFAASIEGRLRVAENGGIFIESSHTHQLIKLKPGSASVEKSLVRLNTGDWISGEGQTLENSEFQLQAVHFVGLKKLLGRWRTSYWDIFDFKDYSKLTLYIQPEALNNEKEAGPVHLSYSISPTSTAKWSIFFVDEEDVQVGSLVFDEGRIRIAITDPNTGKEHQISLFPIKE